ncbi:DgyrCDS8366 [Dimorphilus gyrociliatus]|uniref:DgyrCDS8366 n=1 Tax=Dimorphilus gyrociliatus TaxID=2664684 RepID=A0A7I8VU03_9ANNE|nr:DgyrCDS8366 [Dimorphilus gyrociliatus]
MGSEGRKTRSNSLTELFSLILRMKKDYKFEMIDDLLELVDELQHNYDGIRFSIIRALTERDIALDDFIRVPSMFSSFLNIIPSLKTTAISSFKRGNSQIFFYALKSRPKLIKLFYKTKNLKYFIETSPEIIEFFINIHPDLLTRLDDWLCGFNRIKYKTSILEKDLRNLYKVQIFKEFFSRRDTTYKLFDIWFKNMQSMHSKRMTSDYYYPTLYTIIKCMDQYGLSVEEPGNRFCIWFFEQITETKSTIFSWSNAYNVADKVLHIFIEHGYVFTGNLPTKIHSTHSYGFPEVRKIFYYLASNSVPFPPSFLSQIQMVGKPRSLTNLCVAVIRQSISGPIRKKVNTLPVPDVVKRQMLLEDHDDWISLFKRLDPLEYHDKHLSDKELCDSFLDSQEVDDDHKNCIDVTLKDYEDNFIFQYMYEEGPKFIPFIFFQFGGQVNGEQIRGAQISESEDEINDRFQQTYNSAGDDDDDDDDVDDDNIDNQAGKFQEIEDKMEEDNNENGTRF